MLTKITDFLRNVKYGLQNYWKWKRLIYNDRDWDWAFLYRIMASKMDNMADYHEKHGVWAGKDNAIHDLRECAKRLRRVEEEDYETDQELTWEVVHKLVLEDEEWVYSVMKEKARSWWD